MHIIKPYGKTTVKNQKRTLILKKDWKTEKDISEFSISHSELVIAQWISTIDKIATKPSGTNGTKKATPGQYALRQKLGEAAWACLEKNNLLPTAENDEKVKLKKVWDWKIHPYDSSTKENNTISEKGSEKGRWYNRFAGENTKPAEIEADTVAEKIYCHLHKNQLRLKTGRPDKRKGLSKSRAESITNNVLKPQKKSGTPEWSEDSRGKYTQAGDVAHDIKKEGESSSVPARIVARVLFAHWGKVFKGDNQKALTVSEAKEQKPELFSLHMAIKDYYKRTLKGHRKKNIAHILPENMEELYKKLEQKKTNQDVNALIRLGKVVHYTASGNNKDSTEFIADHWPDETTVGNSFYWTSEGQAQIKRNEAFVRIWRLVLAHAARTLKSWGDPDNQINGDILEQANRDRAVRGYHPNNRQSNLLFNTDRFQDSQYLEVALNGISELRNSSFHFKGLNAFATSLTILPKTQKPEITAFWNEENEARQTQLQEMMVASHFDYFFDEEQNRKLYETLSSAQESDLPLPRFNGMLQRFENAWKVEETKLPLPAPAKRDKLKEHPALQCQYTALKLLYERPFRAGLTEFPKEILNACIKKSVERTTRVAKQLNKNGMIPARAASIGVEDTKDFQEFFFRLSSEMASEMRVQRGYESDAEKAREQTEYIENLKCDVLLRAFQDYLDRTDFAFIAKLNEETKKPPAPLFKRNDRFKETPRQDESEYWQHLLYFLLHLVPVEEISTLLHQIRKWEILADKAKNELQDRPAVAKLQQVLGLYLERHDAKFTGGMNLTVPDELQTLFESEGKFLRVFPKQDPRETDSMHRPLRGLREIQRFGDLSVLRPVFREHIIRDGEIEKYLELNEDIAKAQKTREKLHADLSRNKQKPPEKLRAYARALQTVIQHRHLAAQVTLTNHVRLRRLMMAVLGRLVDYAGLWERDLYFVTLARLHESGQTPRNAFMEDQGLERLLQGRIVDAVRGLADNELKQSVEKYCGSVNGVNQYRNNFAHFNMLNGTNVSVNLTELVNDARQLMAYDRKLKNAVSKSIIELLRREGVSLSWEIQDHKLTKAKLSPQQISHLKNGDIWENLHGEWFIKMVSALFYGIDKQGKETQITERNLDEIGRNAGEKRGDKRSKGGKR